MKKIILFFLASCIIACNENQADKLDVQQIIDKAIEASGGIHHEDSNVSFSFRDKQYVAQIENGKKILKRITYTDSLKIIDIKKHNSFQRFFNDSLISIPDSIANRYSNSVNSVHYFARLPFGLNDPAVHKELIGEVEVNGASYYKVKVTFDENDGGDDFDDIYIYWFNKASFKPDFLAYEFHVNGGGIRFRQAFNERYINEIRFVDYNNYKANNKKVDIYKIDSLFANNALELLSKIELKDIKVEEAN
ncbi:DUF6503 family protein [Croceitalea rosinachiae]|uniref:DUF6503 family protein n=1 Tax=Croceitalea rosinachiae TaxID=3075596 RepID=A0ABU3ABK8_9FLAO|nr:DUF6503 family protein [Croceitalea sp. F388]MDT0607293.1 DUF6503 family protein [Croceitalea sp. F388]